MLGICGLAADGFAALEQIVRVFVDVDSAFTSEHHGVEVGAQQDEGRVKWPTASWGHEPELLPFIYDLRHCLALVSSAPGSSTSSPYDGPWTASLAPDSPCPDPPPRRLAPAAYFRLERRRAYTLYDEICCRTIGILLDL